MPTIGIFKSSVLPLLACLLLGNVARADELQLAMGDVSLNKLPFVMAFEEGIYERNGLSVVPKFMRGAVEIIRKSGVDVPDKFILEGHSKNLIKIGGASPHIVRLTTEAGAWDPLIVGSTHIRSRWRLIGSPEFDSLEDLKGRRIGFSGVGAVSHFMAMQLAERMGWNPRYDWSMLSDALGVDALEAGYVDAIIAPELHATMAIDAGYHVLEDLQDFDLPVAGSSILVDREWYADHRAEVGKFVKSAVEAIALLKTDKEAAFRTLGKWYGMHDPELLEFFYAEAGKLPSKPYPPVDGLRKMMQVYDSHEMRRYKLEHFYDDSLVRELDESGFIDSLYE